jgi:hypothetical protein
VALASGTWPKLAKLDVGGSNIGAAGARALASAHWPNLTTLEIVGNRIGASGAASLASANWPKLTHLHVSDNAIASQGAFALAKASGKWPNLASLLVAKNGIGNEGAATLAAGKWPRLTTLSVQDNGIEGLDGACALAAGDWPQLLSLDVARNRLGSKGLLIQIGISPSLTELDITEPGIACGRRSSVWAAFENANWRACHDARCAGYAGYGLIEPPSGGQWRRLSPADIERAERWSGGHRKGEQGSERVLQPFVVELDFARIDKFVAGATVRGDRRLLSSPYDSGEW